MGSQVPLEWDSEHRPLFQYSTLSGGLRIHLLYPACMLTRLPCRVYLMPMLGAYLADAHWGRYKTVCVATGVALLGHCLLVYSALPSTLEDPQHAFRSFIFAILVMGCGTGAFKSNISPLVAEQYQRRSHIRTLPSGERVYVDRQMTIARIYIMFYVFINVGSLAGQIAMTYTEKVSIHLMKLVIRGSSGNDSITVSGWHLRSQPLSSYSAP